MGNKTLKEELYKLDKELNARPEGVSISEPVLLDSLLKWNDIMALDVTTEYLVAGLVPKGSITLLFGRGGIGKTSLCMQIARIVAGGLSFGNITTIKTPVYYIDFENPLSVLKARVELIGLSDNLYVWHISNTPQPPKLDSSGWELYKQLPPGLLIFDTLRASHLSDENDSKPMSLIMGRLKELREIGFTVLLLHHTPKGNDDTFKGSTALLDLCDHVLGLQEVRADDTERVEFDCHNLYRLGVRIKTRYEPFSTHLVFDPAIKGFRIATDPDIDKMQEIFNILNSFNRPAKQKELKNRAIEELDLSEREARRLLTKGDGLYWETTKGDKNATLFIPKNSVCQLDTPIGAVEQTNSYLDTPCTPSNRQDENTGKTLANTEFDSLTDALCPTDKQADFSLTQEQRKTGGAVKQESVIDLTGDDVEIVG